MPDPFIINVCLTGMVPTREMSASLPITPQEIARDVEACLELGASIFHVHARDERQQPDWRVESCSTIMRAIREVTADAIVCVSTSGRDVSEVERRADSLRAEPRPDLGSLTLGSINFMRDATRNSPAAIEALIEAMDGLGILPELEIFDVGMARTAARLTASGKLRSPGYANILLGNIASADATPLDLAAILQYLPDGMVRCIGGIGKSQLAATALGILYANGVRVGLEDNLYMDEDKTPATNPGLVERVVDLGRLLGRRPATIPETRQMLGI